MNLHKVNIKYEYKNLKFLILTYSYKKTLNIRTQIDMNSPATISTFNKIIEFRSDKIK